MTGEPKTATCLGVAAIWLPLLASDRQTDSSGSISRRSPTQGVVVQPRFGQSSNLPLLSVKLAAGGRLALFC